MIYRICDKQWREPVYGYEARFDSYEHARLEAYYWTRYTGRKFRVVAVGLA